MLCPKCKPGYWQKAQEMRWWAQITIFIACHIGTVVLVCSNSQLQDKRVAALPSPNRFALMFIVILLKPRCFYQTLEKRSHKKRRKIFEIKCVKVTFFCYFHYSDHRHGMPADPWREFYWSDEPLSIRAVDSDSVLPSKIAKTTLTIIRPAYHICKHLFHLTAKTQI